MMRHLKWILLGSFLGFGLGKWFFPQSAEPTASDVSGMSTSVLDLVSGRLPTLAVPKVEALTVEAALQFLQRPALSGTKEHAAFYLGVLRLAKTLEIGAIADLLNAAPRDLELEDLASSLFEQLAKRDPEASFAAAQSLANTALGRKMMRVVIEQWTIIDAEAAFTFIDQLPAELAKDRKLGLMGMAIQALASKDPEAAIAKADQLGKPHYYQSILNRWISQDYKASFRWLQTLEDPSAGLVEGALRSLIVHAPEEAVAFSVGLPHEGRGRHPAQSLVQQWAAMPLPDAVDKAMESLGELPDELLTEDFIERFASHVVIGDPDKAIGYADQLPKESLKEPYWGRLISQVAYKDPVKAAGLTDRLPEGEHLAQAYEWIMRSWAKTDEFAAAKWLAEVTPSESKDKAIRVFSEELLLIDPERALQWASAINDPDRRTAQIDRLVAQWEKTDDSAARAWQDR